MLCESDDNGTFPVSLYPCSTTGNEGYDCTTRDFRLGLSFVDL
jgi:hypothetical protein